MPINRFYSIKLLQEALSSHDSAHNCNIVAYYSYGSFKKCNQYTTSICMHE